ncbi:MAG: PIN domain-containing protein [Comamonadaceae bacterium]|nr:MAG: PIN domain-containing protein [Comamonadaceae bacterium]
MVIVLDTNIVLDVFVFNDPVAEPVRAGLRDASLDWIATAPMRVELERVLGYKQIVPRLAFYKLEPADVLSAFDRHARIVEVASKTSVTCSDADDQCFIDLAVAHGATLLSKDRAVTSMTRRLMALGVSVSSAL